MKAWLQKLKKLLSHKKIIERRNNYYLSLGENCFVRTVATRQGLKDCKSDGELSMPFDLCVSSVRGTIQIIKNDFRNYFDGLYWDQEKQQWENKELRLGFNHDKDCDQNNRDMLVQRYTNRIKNMHKLRKNKKLACVFSTVNANTSPSDINELYKVVKAFFARTDLKFIVIDCSKAGVRKTNKISHRISYAHIPHPYPNYWGEWYKSEFFDSEAGRKFEKRVATFIQRHAHKHTC